MIIAANIFAAVTREVRVGGGHWLIVRIALIKVNSKKQMSWRKELLIPTLHAFCISQIVLYLIKTLKADSN